jgi:glycosyltransferase involved in cell wall biosynthesis
MALQFFPRGGSAHVARNLAHALPCDVTIVSGSIAGHGDAARFYRGLDVRPVDMTHALHSADPMAADPPLHPSYEDRPGAPDRIFACLADEQAEHQVVAWARALQSAGAAHADILHLHHLTPIYEAARRVAPQVPIVGHLHGTELLMLEAIAHEPYRWRYGLAWAERLNGYAKAAERLIVLSETQIERAERLLDVHADRYVHIPNGYDPKLFKPGPRANAFGFGPEMPVILYVGRFTAVKRVNLLIEAYERARPGFRTRAPLVLVGGFPDEWEGEHPRETIERIGARDVHLAGWHDHDELADIYRSGDVVVLPSVREQFGQVLVEGMACGLPAIAVDAHGPADIIRHGDTGWLVEPDDEQSLANALVEAVNRPRERRRRG